MSRFFSLFSAAVFLMFAAQTAHISASHSGRTLAVTMTNDSMANAIQVYDASTHALIQTLSTQGKGGVGGNARGVRQYNGEFFAAVNNGSNSVAVFRRQNDGLKFEKLVTTTSAPVSIDFGNDHMYVAGATTVDSFEIHGNQVGWLDGTTWLQLAGGGLPPNGSTAQIGVVNDRRLLVTLKTDPDPGTVNSILLDDDGAVSGASATAVSAPAGTLTPFGFSVYPAGGAPSDIDAVKGTMGVIDHGGGQSHLSLFTYNGFGELSASGAPITLGVPNANGVAIMSPADE